MTTLGTRTMRADLSAVTINSPDRRVDLLLPNGVPVIELTPLLAELCGLDGDDVRPAAWTLARPGQAPLALTTSLGAAGVLDGEILHMVDLAAWDAPQISPPDELPAESAGDGWTTRVRPVVLAAGGALFVVAASVSATVLPGVRTAAGPALLAAVAALILTAHIIGRKPAGIALACGAVALAAAAGWSLSGGHAIAAGLLAAGLVAGAALVAAAPLLGPALPGIAVVAGSLIAGSACVAAGARPSAVAAIAAVAAAYTLRVAPIMLSRRLRSGAQVARTWLLSLIVGCVLVTLGGTAILVTSPEGFGLALGAAVAASLGLRGATFRYGREALAPTLGAILILAAAEIGMTAGPLAKDGLAGAGIVVLMLTGTGLVLLAVRTPRAIREPAVVARWWAVIDTCTVPMLLGSLGVITALSRWAGHIFG